MTRCVCARFPDLENWNGTDRHHFNAIVPDQDLVEVAKPIHCFMIDIHMHIMSKPYYYSEADLFSSV